MAAARHNHKRLGMLDWALAYAAKNVPVFPLAPNSKIPTKGSRGCLDATTDEARIRAWWGRTPNANIGGATGRGLVAIDEDTYKGADVSAWLLPVTRTARSTRGGRHWWYLYDKPLKGVPENQLAPGVCIKADGGYVVLPPSTVNGKAYTWENPQQPFARLPEHVVAMIEAHHARQPAAEPEPSAAQPPKRESHTEDEDAGGYWLDQAMKKTGDGNGDATGYWLAQQVLIAERNGRRVDVRDILGAYADFATVNASDPFDERDVERWLRSAERSQLVARGQPAKSQTPRPLRPEPQKQQRHAPRTDGANALHDEPEGDDADPPPPDEPPDEPPPAATPDYPIHNTDMGNARRFVRLHSATVRYVAVWDTWLLWDGRRWRKDDTEEVARLAKETVRSIYQEAAECTDDLERKELAKWASRSENDSRIRALLAQARSEPEIATASTAFDADPWLLNCHNGTLELTTGTLREHRQADLLTLCAEADYLPDATCPLWLRFLATIFTSDETLIAYVQRAIGYALSGDTSEQCLFILHGTGANGKSTLLDVWARILADYGMATPTDTLMEKRNQSIPSDVARLVGARFVTASESGDGRRLDEEFIKRATGGERIPARFLHKEWFDFYPVFKLFLAVNHKPTIRGQDMGIWRRVHLWPFEVTIAPSKQDKRLVHKLLAEAPGILAWAVRGLVEWRRLGGLQPPEKVQEAVQGYQTEMDAFAGFCDDCCIFKQTALTGSKALVERYKAWCEQNGEHELSATRLGTYLRERRNCQASRDAKGNRAWLGVGLIYEGET